MFARSGFESRSSRRVGILASDMALDRGLILVCRFSFVSSRVCIPVAAQARSCLQGWMHMRNPLLLPNG
jgi:hypothetical protein